MSRRTPETLADYLAVAVCPFLIFLLVSSLMFFLVEVFHEGEYKQRLTFVMAMFCMAIVCIARIAMEEGYSYATLYAFPLGVAVAFAVWRLVPGGIVISLPLMGIVWWAAHKLTWDCTLVDDSQDASGQGLLQEMGLDPLNAQVGQSSALSYGTTTRTQPESTTGPSEPDKTWWDKLIEPDRRPHAPGVWVVYFSLAALPLFGIGGWFVPASDPESRARIFRYLVIYVASGMGLLLATSFLGLRRYLRQRNLEMPVQMTGTWITAGVGLILATLVVATILPRTSAEHSLSGVPKLFVSAVRQASRFAVGGDGTSDNSNPDAAQADAQENQSSDKSGGTKGEASKGQGNKSKSKSKGSGDSSSDSSGGDSQGESNDQGDDSGKNQEPGSKSKSRQAKGDKSQGSKSDGDRSQQDGSDSGEQKSGQNQSPQEQSQNGSQTESSDNQQPQEQPQSPPRSRPLFNFSIGGALFTLLKLLFWLALVVAAVIAGWFYREELAAAWQKLLTELRELWERWFGGKPVAAQQPAAAAELPVPPRPFAAFGDPFASGEAARMPWPELIRYTFAAVEAWGREHDCPRHADQTPHEFAQSLAALEPQIGPPVQSLAGLYGQLAYAPRAASAGATEPLRQLWQKLRRNT